MSDTASSAAVKRVQSPDYPAISLKEAVSRIERLFREIQRHPAPRDIVARGLGYTSLNGASMSAIAALRKYGLLLKKSDTLRLSDRATEILFPRSEEERQIALKAAALTPPLFKELYEVFGDSLPTDELVRNYLIRKGFLLNSASIALASYKETLSLVSGFAVNLPEEETFGSSDAEDEEPTNSPSQAPDMAFVSPAVVPERPAVPSFAQLPNAHVGDERTALSPSKERRLFDYEIESGGNVGVVVRGSVDTEEALDIIATWIEIKRKELTRKARLVASSTLEARAEKVEGTELAPSSVPQPVHG